MWGKSCPITLRTLGVLATPPTCSSSYARRCASRSCRSRSASLAAACGAVRSALVDPVTTCLAWHAVHEPSPAQRSQSIFCGNCPPCWCPCLKLLAGPKPLPHLLIPPLLLLLALPLRPRLGRRLLHPAGGEHTAALPCRFVLVSRVGRWLDAPSPTHCMHRLHSKHHSNSAAAWPELCSQRLQCCTAPRLRPPARIL